MIKIYRGILVSRSTSWSCCEFTEEHSSRQMCTYFKGVVFLGAEAAQYMSLQGYTAQIMEVHTIRVVHL